MTLLEITLVLALGISIVAGAGMQTDNQMQILKTYKQVEYYSKDVPRMFTAVQNLTRGAKQFTLNDSPPAAMGGAVTVPTWWRVASGKSSGNSITIYGDEKREGAIQKGGTAVRDEHVTLLWMVARDGIKQVGDRCVDSTGAYDLPDNIYNLAVASVKNPSSSGAGFGQAGWILCRNVADVRFDFIPDSDGAVLMRVYRQEKAGEKAKLAFEVVLERR